MHARPPLLCRVHYSTLAYNNCQAALTILGVPYSGLQSLSRVLQSLQATSVVYCIFSACIICLGTARGMMESDLVRALGLGGGDWGGGGKLPSSFCALAAGDGARHDGV